MQRQPGRRGVRGRGGALPGRAVFSPYGRRGGDYGSTAPAAVTRAALDEGADEVVLVAGRGNPTNNAIYDRLGCRPVQDRLVTAFTLAGVAARRSVLAMHGETGPDAGEVRRWLGAARRVTVLTGAGISTDIGRASRITPKG